MNLTIYRRELKSYVLRRESTWVRSQAQYLSKEKKVDTRYIREGPLDISMILSMFDSGLFLGENSEVNTYIICHYGQGVM